MDKKNLKNNQPFNYKFRYYKQDYLYGINKVFSNFKQKMNLKYNKYNQIKNKKKFKNNYQNSVLQQSREQIIIDPVSNLEDYILNLRKKYIKSFYYAVRKLGDSESGKFVFSIRTAHFDRVNTSFWLYFRYYKKILKSFIKKNIYNFMNFYESSLLIRKKNNWIYDEFYNNSKNDIYNYKLQYALFTKNKSHLFQHFFSFINEKFLSFHKLISSFFNNNYTFKVYDTFFSDILKTKIESYCSFFLKKYSVFYYRKNYSNFFYNNYFSTSWILKKYKGIYTSLNTPRKKRYFFRLLQDTPEVYREKYTKTKIRFRKIRYRSLSRLIFRKKKKNKRVYFPRFKRYYWFKQSLPQYNFLNTWRHSRLFSISRKRYFYFLENMKKYYSCFFILNHFFNFYSHSKNYNLAYMYKQFGNYTSYNYLFNKHFESNYKKMFSLLSCNYNNIKLFLSRKKTIFKIHFFNRLISSKKKIKNYYYYLNKKLFFLNNVNFIKKKKSFLNSYIYDSSFFYSDHIINWKYIDQVDEKFHFYIKHFLFRKINKNILNDFNIFSHIKKKWSLYSHSADFQYNYNYSINIEKPYFCLDINSISFNSFKNNIFYLFNTIKLTIFILKKNIFLFFRDSLICKFKNLLYSITLLKNNKKYGFFNIFKKGHFLTSLNLLKKKKKKLLGGILSKKDDILYNKLKKVSILYYYILENHTFLSDLNNKDWFSMIYHFYKKKNIYYLRRYSFLYNNILKFFKKKQLFKSMKNIIFSKKYKYSFKKIKSFLTFKNKYFNTFLKRKEKIEYISLYKYYLSILSFNLLFKKKKKFYKKKENSSKLNTLFYKSNKGINSFYKHFFSVLKNMKKYSRFSYKKYFEIFDNAFHFSNRKKIIKKNKNLSIFHHIWKTYLLNKKLLFSFINPIINFLYLLKYKDVTNTSSFFHFYFIISALNFRNNDFSYFQLLQKNNIVSKNVNKKSIIKEKKSYILSRKRKNIFFLSNQYHIILFFFNSFKRLVLEQVLFNSFSFYKNKILFYNFKDNFVFSKEKVYQFDFSIKNYLNQEIEIYIK